jgi:hypothetical protein
MNLGRAAVLAACAAIAAGAVGCGGDDDSTSGDETTAATETVVTTADITKEEWIQQADQICADADADIGEQAQEAGIDGNDEAELQDFIVDVVIPSNRDQEQQIRALGAPEGEEEAVTEILDALDAAVDQAEEDPESVTADSGEFDEVTELAQDYGLVVCGNNG